MGIADIALSYDMLEFSRPDLYIPEYDFDPKSWDPNSLRSPTPTEGILNVYPNIAVRGWIHPNVPGLDAGHGDGRWVGMLRSLEYDIVGMEQDSDMYALSEEHMKKLQVENQLPEGQFLMHGDFLRDEDYKKYGRRFEEFGWIIMYHIVLDEMAEKIARQSPNGTTLIVESHKDELPPLPLEFQMTIPLSAFDENYQMHKWSYLHVYKKQTPSVT